jgi:enediyne polyketide synthase
VRDIEARLGPVTAVLHGAGSNTPRPFSALEAADFRATVAPKLAGARHLAAALDPDRLKLFLAFGSIIARTGLRGEADYAAANEWLAAWVRRFQAEHPRCRCRVVEWSVWSGVGMGERLGRVDALVRDGIAPIPPAVGVRTLLRLIDARLSDPAVIVAGRFGPPPTVTLDDRGLPLLRFLEQPRVHYPGIELVAESELSTDTDPYLEDHALGGEMLLPAVMGLEAMAQAAVGLGGDADALVFEDVTFSRPIVVPRAGSEKLRVAALAHAEGDVEIALRCAATRFQVDHFHARCHRQAAAAGAAPPLVLEGEERVAGRLGLDPARDLYGTALFQRGRFQRLAGFRWLRATECVAEISAADAAAWFGPYTPAALVLGDPGGRDAALHAVQACIPHRRLLPVAVERIECAHLPASGLVVRARERGREGDTFVYDLEITVPGGAARERWTGLRLRAIGPARTPESWAEPLLACYLERRIGELLPEARVGVSIERNGSGADGAGGRAVQVSLSRRAIVSHRPDGRPEIAADPGSGVSAARAGATTMAVAGRDPLGCDVEPVTPRPDETWRALLGPDRWLLAEQVAGEAGEEAAAARTRIWAALECLKKAGAPAGTPLTLRAVPGEGWVVLGAGPWALPTFVAAVGPSRRPLAFAVLAGTRHAGV